MSERGTKQPATWWLAVPAGIALVASGVVMGRTGARPITANVQPEVENVSKADDRRFAVLEQELLRLQAAVEATSRKEAPAETEEKVTESGSVQGEPEDPVEAERALDEARAEFLDGLGEQLDTEPPDARWRRETEPVIWRLLPQHFGSDVTVSGVSCGASLCRAKVEHPLSPRLSEDRLANFMLQRESLGTMQVQLDTRDIGTTTLYFVRGEHQ